MKVAVIGSRNLTVTNLEQFLPKEITEIVSGGARGIDTCTKKFAKAHHIKLTEFLPQYEQYGRRAPLERNLQIIEYADLVFAFLGWSIPWNKICHRQLQTPKQNSSSVFILS